MTETAEVGDRRLLIVGGGISGLATAHAVAAQARARSHPVPQITVLERAERVGGKVQTEHAEGYTCEWGPAGFLDREPATLQLCRDLELPLLPASDVASNRYLYVGGDLRPVPISPIKFLASPILSWRGKLRLAAEPFAPSRSALAEEETVASFARRRIGDEAFRTLIDAMQSGIYAGDAERMSVRSCFPRVLEVEREHGSLVWGMVQVMRQRRRDRRRGGASQPLPGAGPSGRLTSCPGGLQRLTDRLAAVQPGRVELGLAARRLERDDDGTLVVEADDGRRLPADAAVIACPSFAAAKLLRPLDAALADVVAEIRYSPMVVACLGYRRERVSHPLDGFGFLAPRDQGLRPLGALFSSAIFAERAPEGRVLLRVMLGGARDAAILELSDDELAAVAHEQVGGAVGAKAPPEMVRIFRHREAIPQYEIGHEARLARIDSIRHRHPGLFLTGNAYRGIGVNDCARNAWTAAEEVLSYLGSSPPSASTRRPR